MKRAVPVILSLLLLMSSSGMAADPQARDKWLRQAELHLKHQRWAAAINLLQKANTLSPLEDVEAYAMACALAQVGRQDEALSALERAMASGFEDLAVIQDEELLASLKTRPRFKQLMDKAQANQQLQGRLDEAAALKTPFSPQLPVEQRVAGLSRLWSEVKYNFANFDLVPQLDWDALYLETLPKVLNAPDTLTYTQELTRMAARLQDGHTNVYPPEELMDEMYARPAMRVRMVEGRVLVTEVTPGAPGVQGVQMGDEIVRIQGQATQAYAQAQVDPFVSSSTPQDRRVRTYGYQLLLGSSREPLQLTLQRADGTVTETTVTRLTRSQHQAIKTPDTPPFEWKMLAGQVAWVRLNSFDGPAAANAYRKHFEAIRQAEAIIFDLRQNGGGSSDVGYQVLGTLTAKPFATAQWSTRRYVPVWRAWGRSQAHLTQTEHAQPDASRQYKGRVVVLTSAQTFSAAEDFAAAFKQMHRGPIIGEPSGGSTGQPLMIQLPGGLEARICTKRDKMADGTEFVGKGVAVDVLVTETFAGARQGKDEVLQAALAWLKQGQR